MPMPVPTLPGGWIDLGTEVLCPAHWHILASDELKAIVS